MSSKKGEEVATDGKPKKLPRQMHEEVPSVYQLPAPIRIAAGCFPNGHSLQDAGAKTPVGEVAEIRIDP